MSMIYERYYHDAEREKTGKLSTEQEIAWDNARRTIKRNIKDLDSSPGFGEKVINFFSMSFMSAVSVGIAAAAGAAVFGVGAGIAGASSAMVDTMGMAGAITGSVLLLGGAGLSTMFDIRKERDQLMDQRDKLMSQFPRIIDSDEKADSILKAGFKDADDIFNATQAGKKDLVDAVGSEEVANQLIDTAKGVYHQMMSR